MNSNELKYMELIKSKNPQLDLSKIEFNKTGGNYSDIVIINNKEIFKFAKHDWTAVFLKNEAKVLNFIRDFIDMPLPKAEMIEQNVTRRPYIKGSPLYRHSLFSLDYFDQNSIARQIADFLYQLHSIPAKKAQHSKIENSQMNRTREDWLLELDTLQVKIHPYCTDYVKNYLRQILQPVLDNENFFDFEPVLIHGDLTPDHILLDNFEGKINGIIGFATSGFGDPAYDFGVLLDHLGESFVKRICKYYPLSPAYLDRARFYAYISSFMWYRDIADMISARDFSNFRIQAKDRDIFPRPPRKYR